MSNAEYDYTIRDLTGVDIRPGKEFPVDPANEAGFDNSAESLTMSSLLLNKYLDAARQVSEHLVFLPDGLTFAPYSVIADTDRDKFCVRQIIDFYKRQRTDYADYFQAAWNYRHRAVLGQPNATLADVAAKAGVSAKYLTTIWDVLNGPAEELGPIAALRALWQELPSAQKDTSDVRAGCEQHAGFRAATPREAGAGGQEPDRPADAQRLAAAGDVEEPPNGGEPDAVRGRRAQTPAR